MEDSFGGSFLCALHVRSAKTNFIYDEKRNLFWKLYLVEHNVYGLTQ